METTKDLWNGFERINFKFEDRDATIVFPDGERCGKWLFKTEYFDAFPNFEIEMVKRGWCLAFIKNITRWCLDEDLDLKARFADFLSKEFDLYKKCVPVGMSCGGLIGSKFAAKYPEYVSCLYLDAPVLNLLSCPAGIGEANHEYDFIMQQEQPFHSFCHTVNIQSTKCIFCLKTISRLCLLWVILTRLCLTLKTVLYWRNSTRKTADV